MADLRVGLGFDSHARDDDRPLFLGGVLFEGEAGLAGHSDGDVVCHALGDALLGAAGLGDLGQHFPDSDPAMRGIAGLDLLRRTVALLGQNRAVSCDVVLVAERPLIGDRREEMRARLAEAMGLDAARVSVKATRPEGLTVQGDGVACFAVAVVAAPGP